MTVREPDLFADVPDPAVRALPAAAPPPKLDEASPSRAGRTRRALVAAATAIVSGTLLVLLLGLRADAGQHVPSFVLLAASAAVTLLLLAPGRRLAPRRGPLAAALVVVPFAFAAIVVVLAKERTLGEFGWADLCFVFGTVTALVPLAVVAFAVARTFVTSSTLRGAALGLVCGVVGSFSIHLHCDVPDIFHVLAGHGLPMIVSTGIGAWVGRRFGRV